MRNMFNIIDKILNIVLLGTLIGMVISGSEYTKFVYAFFAGEFLGIFLADLFSSRKAMWTANENS